MKQQSVASFILKMGIIASRFLKFLIGTIAVLNIIVMMVFEYGIPSSGALLDEEDSIEQTAKDDKDVGTIESVEQEAAAKEAEEAETALAREEVQKEEEDEEEQDPEAPILELTDDHIYLKVGERFNYMSYIKTMEDIDGSDLSHYIYLDKDVDTSEPGDTELTYRITSAITGKSSSKVLLITVME